MKEHYWDYCHLCEHDVVICGKCGNNTCNGGYGEVDGKECDACPSAYDLYLNTPPEDRPKQTKEKPEQCSRCGVWMDPKDMCVVEEFCEHYSWVIDE
jgi:hypothetical protein